MTDGQQFLAMHDWSFSNHFYSDFSLATGGGQACHLPVSSPVLLSVSPLIDGGPTTPLPLWQLNSPPPRKKKLENIIWNSFSLCVNFRAQHMKKGNLVKINHKKKFGPLYLIYASAGNQTPLNPTP